mmetsp:Transcript_3452/g.8036  ORF Transcript_3452/g.8036 Transcript_3452/m.8036 type:complete len:258 (-) Transcript_3452:45-818(-)
MPATWSSAWRLASSWPCSFSNSWYCFSFRTRSCSWRASSSTWVFILSSALLFRSCSHSARRIRTSSARSWPSRAARAAISSCVLAVVRSAPYFPRSASNSLRNASFSLEILAVWASSVSRRRRSSAFWSVMIFSCLSLSAFSACAFLSWLSAARALDWSSKLTSRRERFSSSTASFSIWILFASSSSLSRFPRSCRFWSERIRSCSSFIFRASFARLSRAARRSVTEAGTRSPVLAAVCIMLATLPPPRCGAALSVY